MKFLPVPLRGLALLGLLFAAPTQALDYQVHGFAAQAYLLSEGNNYYGNSEDGSHDFYELGLNGSVNLGHGVLVAAQGVVRDAGLTDSGKPRLDYALIDWAALQTAQATGGLRLGRVKNAFGLYNDTRDVMFSRPGILLPSVYFEGAGLRSLFFSSDGAQLYGNHVFGEHELGLEFSAALNRELSDREKRSLSGGMDLPVDVHVENLFFTRLSDEWSGGRLNLALSHVQAGLRVEPTAAFPLSADFDAKIYMVSARYNAERYSLSAEYQNTRSQGHSSLEGPINSASDGGYVQADYRYSPAWSGFLRYDATFSDLHDRDGSEAAAATGEPRHSRFAHAAVAGLSWTYGVHWGVRAELHRIYGTATAPALDNPDGADDAHWTLFAIMAGYRF